MYNMYASEQRLLLNLRTCRLYYAVSIYYNQWRIFRGVPGSRPPPSQKKKGSKVNNDLHCIGTENVN